MTSFIKDYKKNREVLDSNGGYDENIELIKEVQSKLRTDAELRSKVYTMLTGEKNIKHIPFIITLKTAYKTKNFFTAIQSSTEKITKTTDKNITEIAAALKKHGKSISDASAECKSMSITLTEYVNILNA